MSQTQSVAMMGIRKMTAFALDNFDLLHAADCRFIFSFIDTMTKAAEISDPDEMSALITDMIAKLVDLLRDES